MRQRTLKISEPQLTAQILNYLRWALHGAWIRKNLGTLGQRRGIPDIEVIYEGIPYFLEVKTPSGKLSKYQEREIKALREAGELGLKMSKLLFEIVETKDVVISLEVLARYKEPLK